MGCNSDYMEANAFEIQISKVACILDELKGKTKSKNPSHWAGYHPAVYNRGDKKGADALVATLCEKLTAMDPEAITKLSLEAQVWWRDHQEADKKRIDKEKADAKLVAQKQKALKKLTKSDRTALGI